MITKSTVKRVTCVCAIMFMTMLATVFEVPMFEEKVTRYELLYWGLSEEDSIKIRYMLEVGNEVYVLDNEDGAIYLPKVKVHQWRMEIANRGFEFENIPRVTVFPISCVSPAEYETDLYKVVRG